MGRNRVNIVNAGVDKKKKKKKIATALFQSQLGRQRILGKMTVGEIVFL